MAYRLQGIRAVKVKVDQGTFELPEDQEAVDILKSRPAARIAYRIFGGCREPGAPSRRAPAHYVGLFTRLDRLSSWVEL